MKNSINNTNVDIRSLIYFLSSLRRKRLEKVRGALHTRHVLRGKAIANKQATVHLWYFLFRKFLPLATQWAAVTTHLSDTRDPPQKCRFSRMRHRLTCHGFEPAKTFFPPTILPRPWGGIMGRPQTNRRKVKFANEFVIGRVQFSRCCQFEV